MLHASFFPLLFKMRDMARTWREIIEEWLIGLNSWASMLESRTSMPLYIWISHLPLKEEYISLSLWILDLAIWFAFACVEWSVVSRGLKCVLIGPLELLPFAMRTDLTLAAVPVSKRTWGWGYVWMEPNHGANLTSLHPKIQPLSTWTQIKLAKTSPWELYCQAIKSEIFEVVCYSV